MSTPGVINFPSLLDDAVSLIETKDNASATLVSGIDDDDLNIPVTQPSEFPNTGFATIVDSLINPTTIEIVLFTSKSGSNLVVPGGGRGQFGTTPAAFSAGAVVEQRPIARLWTVLQDAIIAMQTAGPAGIYTSVGNGTTIANTAAETSVFTGMSSSAGSSRTIQAGGSRAGTAYRLRAFGNVAVTGTPTLQMKVKMGSVTLADTGAVAMTNNVNGRWWVDIPLLVSAVGGAGAVQCFPEFRYSSAQTGLATMVSHVAANNPAVNHNIANDLDLTFQWGTASASNSLATFGVIIERIR